MAVMGRYVDIAGHPTWVEELGEGRDTILLLHGGMSNGDQLLDAIGGPLGERYRLVAFDRRGHGRTADTEAAFHYDEMAAETIAVIEQVVGGPVHAVGWSDGGIVSLLVAQRRPDLITRQVLIGTNYHHDGLRPFDIDPSSPLASAMYDAYLERTPDGAEHFPILLDKAITLFAAEPTMTTDELRTITTPTLVMAGDDDSIELSHTASLFESLPNGQLAIVPRTSHALPIEAPAEVARLTLEFLEATIPPDTMMPSRRR